MSKADNGGSATEECLVQTTPNGSVGSVGAIGVGKDGADDAQKKKKKDKLPTDEEMAAAYQPMLSNLPPAPPQPAEEHPHILYPDETTFKYSFENTGLQFAGKPCPNEYGEIVYLDYSHTVGSTGKKMKAPSLTFQLPTMFTPTGIMAFKDKQINCILSLGADWESHPEMVAFREFTQELEAAFVALIWRSGWAGKDATQEQIAEMLMPIVNEDESKPDAKGERKKYPPSVRAHVEIRGLKTKDRTSVFLAGTNQRLTLGDVTPKSTVTTILSIRWLFRKEVKLASRKTTMQFMPNILLKQCVLHPSMEMESPDGLEACHVKAFGGEQVGFVAASSVAGSDVAASSVAASSVAASSVAASSVSSSVPSSDVGAGVSPASDPVPSPAKKPRLSEKSGESMGKVLPPAVPSPAKKRPVTEEDADGEEEEEEGMDEEGEGLLPPPAKKPRV